MPYEQYALELLIKTERIYQGVDRSEMKKTFVGLIKHTQQPETCPLFMGLVVVSGLKMLDECPDYY